MTTLRRSGQGPPGRIPEWQARAANQRSQPVGGRRGAGLRGHVDHRKLSPPSQTHRARHPPHVSLDAAADRRPCEAVRAGADDPARRRVPNRLRLDTYRRRPDRRQGGPLPSQGNHYCSDLENRRNSRRRPEKARNINAKADPGHRLTSPSHQKHVGTRFFKASVAGCFCSQKQAVAHSPQTQGTSGRIMPNGLRERAHRCFFLQVGIGYLLGPGVLKDLGKELSGDDFLPLVKQVNFVQKNLVNPLIMPSKTPDKSINWVFPPSMETCVAAVISCG